ncbi:MAG: hypothetical protein FWH24_01460 [Oscillospiraceae bacterium]|nr:hypothetical protein [Oscillospiraceae bacterium]
MEVIKNPSPEAIEQAIDGIIPAAFHFVILEANSRLNGCGCIQTIIKWDDKPQIDYMVEAHFKADGKFTYYRHYTTDADWLKKLFRLFALDIIPDVEGWEDATADVLRQIEKSRKKKDG